MNRGDRLQPTPRVFVAYARSGPLPKKRTHQQDTYQLILELSNNPDKKPSLFYTRKYFPKILEHCYYAIREHPFNLIYPYLKFSETLSIEPVFQAIVEVITFTLSKNEYVRSNKKSL
jgi:hypothetical protein